MIKRIILGILLFIVGLSLTAYLSWTVCFVGGIAQLATALKLTPIMTSDIHWALIRISLGLLTIPFNMAIIGFLSLKVMGISITKIVWRFIQSLMQKRMEKQMKSMDVGNL